MATSTQELPEANVDERLMRENRFRRILRRPELGALGGAIAVWIFFAIVVPNGIFLRPASAANYLEVAAELGILTLAVTLLMIGGEFDLSIGSMIGATGMITTILTVTYGWNLWAALLASLIAALVIGAINGFLVIRTKLPSFIITLGTLFIIRGATIGFTRQITGLTQVRGLGDVPGYDLVNSIFASDIQLFGQKFPIVIVWWMVFTGLAFVFLRYTRAGNWVFGIGGDANAARNVGVPVNRMKIILFMCTAVAAWFIAHTQIIGLGSADVLRGTQREFHAIIAAVIGGTLLTGGYGSAIGALLGALIFGMVQQGIIFAGWDSDWFQVFLGGMVIVAVLINNFIRKRAAEAK
jgi:simple sugar transport system permease protein